MSHFLRRKSSASKNEKVEFESIRVKKFKKEVKYIQFKRQLQRLQVDWSSNTFHAIFNQNRLEKSKNKMGFKILERIFEETRVAKIREMKGNVKKREIDTSTNIDTSTAIERKDKEDFKEREPVSNSSELNSFAMNGNGNQAMSLEARLCRLEGRPDELNQQIRGLHGALTALEIEATDMETKVDSLISLALVTPFASTFF